MSKVRKIRTTVWEADVDDGAGFHPQIALGIALGADEWEIASDTVVFHVEEDGQTWQMTAGRLTDPPPDGELVAAADDDDYGPTVVERDAAGGEEG